MQYSFLHTILPLARSRSIFNNKAFSLYIATGLLIVFVATLSFSVRNYVTQRLSLEIYSSRFQQSDENEDPESVAEIKVRKGDTLKKILMDQKISSKDSALIIQSLKQKKIEFTLKPGQVISFDYDISESNAADEDENDANSLNQYTLKKINIELSAIRSIVIEQENGIYNAQDLKAELHKRYVTLDIKLDNGFTQSLLKQGISSSNIQEIIGAYSYQVDFQRQVKKSDSINVVLEKFYTGEDKFVHNGKIIFSSLNLSGKHHNIYWYKDESSGSNQYYSETGKSIKRNLLRTPLNVAKISSRFGQRQHPVHGFTKMHKGVDFSAPTGTPILAAGDGVVKEMGYMGAYGNMIKLKHSSSLSTGYAHASRFATNLKVGSKVKQGQVIAYVGATGRATGPHCHFEVIINGKHVNPMLVQTTPGSELKSKSLAQFEKHKKSIKQLAKDLAEGKPATLASIDAPSAN